MGRGEKEGRRAKRKGEEAYRFVHGDLKGETVFVVEAVGAFVPAASAGDVALLELAAADFGGDVVADVVDVLGTLVL